MQEWKRLAEAVHKARDAYDAFLVIHGTDTMAYTAAALSLMLVRPSIFIPIIVLLAAQKSQCLQRLHTLSTLCCWQGARRLLQSF